MINGILGVKVKDQRQAKEGGGRDSYTSVVTKYQIKKGKISVTVWDSPGLQDGKTDEEQESYLQQMKVECTQWDLTVYCIRISVQFVRGDHNQDILAMKKLTKGLRRKLSKGLILCQLVTKKLHLPSHPYWLSNLWFHCLGTISMIEKQATLFILGSARFRTGERIIHEDVIRQPEDQPIVITRIQQCVSLARKFLLCRKAQVY